MQDNSPRLVYLGDKKLFKNMSMSGGQSLYNFNTAKTHIMQSMAKTEAEATVILGQIMEVPVLSTSVKTGKQELNWQALYKEVQSLFPVYSRLSTNGERQVYFISSANEATLIACQDDDSIMNSLMNNKALWQKLKAYYNATELLNGHRAAVRLRSFILTIINDFLMMDEDKIIEDQPRNFSWDTSVMAFKQFDPNSVAPGPTPTWDEFTSRLNYPDVFKAWVWSLFEPTNNIRQSLWLTGAGNDGKSAVQKALREVFGPQHVYDCKKGDEQQGWFQSNVFGKSLVNYADCDNPFLLTNQGIKQLTGGDATSIEFKSQSAFSAEIYAKLFITSNMAPQINPDLEAQTSRLIRLKLQPIPKGGNKDSAFKDRLVAECFAFLHQCRTEYAKHINTGNDALILPDELAQEMTSECAEEDYYITLDFVKKYVEFGPDLHCGPGELNTALKYFVNNEMNYSHDKTKYIRAKFDAKIGLKGIRIQTIRKNGEEFFAFLGFKLKPHLLLNKEKV